MWPAEAAVETAEAKHAVDVGLEEEAVGGAIRGANGLEFSGRFGVLFHEKVLGQKIQLDGDGSVPGEMEDIGLSPLVLCLGGPRVIGDLDVADAGDAEDFVGLGFHVVGPQVGVVAHHRPIQELAKALPCLWSIGPFDILSSGSGF